jgi:hypothetical protein
MKKKYLIVAMTILTLTIVYIFSNDKDWNYERRMLVEERKRYNEKYPVIDTLEALYPNVNYNNPIFIHKFNINGHTVIGEMNGGSRVFMFHDVTSCAKCKAFFLSLKGE